MYLVGGVIIRYKYNFWMVTVRYKIVLLLLMFINYGSAVEHIHSKKDYTPLTHKLACAKSEKDAIIKVDKILEKILDIHSPHLYAENVYIRHKKNSKGAFCVEGIVTQKGFDRYSAELDEAYESIMGEIEDLNDGISYAKKQAEVESLYKKVQAFNQKIDKAQKLAPMKVEKIAETKASLSKMINAIPVVNFKVNGCGRKIITGCRLVFVSTFEDDSSSVVYRWYFGDGTQSRRTNPIHYYKHPGRYKVRLRITDGGKKYKEVSKKIYVAAKPKPKVKKKPIASFSTRKKLYVQDESIEFINLSQSEKSTITDYKWRFGNGASSKLCNPQYSYHKSGSYKVHLEVLNSDGLKDEVVENIQVVAPAIKFAVDGRKYNRVVRKFGQPDESIVKKGVLTQAYRYGHDWLLVKQNKVECRINGNVFKTNLMGNPKNCRWYEKHAPSGMFDFSK